MNSLNEQEASIFVFKRVSHECDVIMQHIWERLKLDQQEWRKIFKALHLLEIVIKAGDPQCITSIKGNIYKIKSFQSFTTKVGSEKSAGIREKAKTICELIEDPDKLEEEREKTKELRNKLSGGSYSTGSFKTNDRREVWRDKQ